MLARDRWSAVGGSVSMAALAAAALAASPAARAQVTLDGSLGPSGAVGAGAVNGNPTTYLITDNLGTRAGNNLFHSFNTFNVGAGESATFTGPAGIGNVVARVTGGAPSSVDGVIASTIDGANLFLVNPSGMMFGPNAALDVKGSFHASTADYVKFSDGGIFHSNPHATSVLSVADPAAFGFLAASPAGIVGDGAYLQVPQGETISLVGGDITYRGSPASTDPSSPDFVFNAASVLTAPGGRIQLASLSSPGEVDLASLDTGAAKLGDISFSGAKLSVLDFDVDWNPLPAGAVVIRGGKMVFQDGGIDVYGDPGGVVDIEGDSLQLDSYYVFAASTGDVPHPGAAIEIDLAADLLMTHSSLLDTTNYAAGRGGDVRITAGSVKLGDDELDERSYTGPALGYFGYIATTTGGSGGGGDITISTGNAVIQNGFFINTSTLADGDAGDVSFTSADTLRLRECGSIATNAFGSGRGGDLTISAKDITISSANQAALMSVDPSVSITGIAAQTGSASSGGTLRITADNLQVRDGGKIGTVLFGSGRGADVEIDAKQVTVAGYVAIPDADYYLSSIDARVYGPEATGTGGNITINAGTVNVADAGSIRTALESAPRPAQAGNISIVAGDLQIGSRGQIAADSFKGGSTGDSGDIHISANGISITGAGDSARPVGLDFDFTGLSTTTNSGEGGSIQLTTAGDVTLGDKGGISADTQGTGNGGAVSIQARDVSITGQSAISAGTTASGAAGNVVIHASQVTLQDHGVISTRSSADGAGGTIILDVARLGLASGGEITSTSTGGGDAGNIDITASDSVTMRGSAITTAADLADGGNITIADPSILHMIDSTITASVGGGAQTSGGNIRTASRFVVLEGSQIAANAYEGAGGNIGIVADTFLADPRSSVDASSALGIDGMVDVQAPISNVSGLLKPLSADFVSAAALLRERCLARIRGGKYSSFLVGGRDGLPVGPGSLMPGVAQGGAR